MKNVLILSKFILASASPRRREILTALGLDFEIIPSTCPEEINPSLPPEFLVQELALLKAADVAKKITGRHYVIGADTIVYFNGTILGKPKDSSDAVRMLQALSGNTNTVYTGISVVETASGKSACRYQRTDVTFRPLTQDEIDAYVATGEPLDKAGAYGIQGLGSLLVSAIQGDYFNVVGLPVVRLYELLLQDFDISLL